MLLEFVSLTKANNGKNLQKEKFKIPTTHLTIPEAEEFQLPTHINKLLQLPPE